MCFDINSKFYFQNNQVFTQKKKNQTKTVRERYTSNGELKKYNTKMYEPKLEFIIFKCTNRNYTKCNVLDDSGSGCHFSIIFKEFIICIWEPLIL